MKQFLPEPCVRQTRANEVIISAPVDVAIEHVAEAIRKLGTVKHCDRHNQAVRGCIKYGLQSVKICVSLVERLYGETTTVIQASSDDIWGGSRKECN
jgi:hypothetical protein